MEKLKPRVGKKLDEGHTSLRGRAQLSVQSMDFALSSSSLFFIHSVRLTNPCRALCPTLGTWPSVGGWWGDRVGEDPVLTLPDTGGAK